MMAIRKAISRAPHGPANSHPAALHRLAAVLAGSREGIEAAFVDVGSRLGQCATLLNRITGVFETLPQDLASSELTEATARLSAVGRRARELSASFAAEQNDIARLVAAVTAAGHPISDLRRAVKMMGIVAVNARVAAAGEVGESGDFDVFTTDIAVLSEDAARTIQEFSLAYGQLTGEVRQADEQRAHFEAAHRGTLSGLANRFEANLAEVTERRRASAEGSAETGRVSHQIAERIAKAVMAMQVGDATRQRIEHIEGGLAILADEPTLNADATVVVDTTRVLAAQLADTGRSFDAEVAKAETSLQELAVDAQALMARSHSLYGDEGSRGNSPLATLSAEVHGAITVLRSCEAERSKLEHVASAVQATVKVLLEHVEEVKTIEANMRLVSLNAAVRCAQLGPRGRALDVIARQLRELTGETVIAAQAAMESLGLAATLAQSFSASSSGEAAGQVAWLEREAAAAVVLLETVEKRLTVALDVLNRDGPAAIGLLGQAASGFSSHAGISEAMADAHLGIESLAGEGGRRGISDASRPLLRRLRNTYTMEAERRVHSELVGTDTDDEAKPEHASVSPDAAVDDLLF